MRRVLLLLVILLVASLTGLASDAQAEQIPWQPRLSLYSGEFYSVAFASRATVWAAGPGGIVLSEDGGASWRWASNQSVDSVAAADATHGWAVGAGGTILATTDGGRTWTPQQPPTTSGFYLVAAFDAQRAIALGGRSAGCDVCLPTHTGIVLFTEDGGLNWRQAQLPGEYDLMSLSVLAGGSDAWMSAEKCTSDEKSAAGCVPEYVLLASSDSGKTWEDINTQQYLSDVQFINSSTGWALDTKGLLRTKDGGKSWQQIRDWSAEGKYVSQLTVLNDRTLLLLEQSNTKPTRQIVKSTDGGTSWVPVGAESSDYLPAVPHFFDENHAIRSGSLHPLEWTEDGGTTWRTAAAPAFAFENRYNLEFDFVDPANGWVAATKLLRTRDGGLSWETASDLQLASVDFVSSTEGWAVQTLRDPVTPQAVVLHTSDGGVNWSEQVKRKCSDQDSAVLKFVDPLNGWLTLGGDVPLLHTRDGGLTWSEQQPPGSHPVFVDAATVWVATDPSMTGGDVTHISVSKDGGDSWSAAGSILSPCGSVLLTAVDAENAWLVSSECGQVVTSTLYHTADGGANWTQVGDKVNNSYDTLTFFSGTDGLATRWVCPEGFCRREPLRTLDGGVTWDVLPLPTTADGFQEFQFTDPWHGWLGVTIGGDMASPLQEQVLYAYVGAPQARSSVLMPSLGQGSGEGRTLVAVAALGALGVFLVGLGRSARCRRRRPREIGQAEDIDDGQPTLVHWPHKTI